MAEKLNWKTLAATLGVSPRSMTTWRKLPGAPEKPDPSEWLAFVEERGLGSRQDDPESANLRAEKLKREIALLDLKLQRERAQVIPVDQVDDLLKRIAAGQRSELLHWAQNESPPIVAGADLAEIRANQMDIAHRICDQMETGLSRWLASNDIEKEKDDEK